MWGYTLFKNTDLNLWPWPHHFTGLHLQKPYTHSGTFSSQCVYQICYCMYSLCQVLLLFANAYMHFVWELQLDTQCIYLVYALRTNCNKDGYMHEQTTKGFGKMNICITRFGIRIGDRKYLNECKCKPVNQGAGRMALDIQVSKEHGLK